MRFSLFPPILYCTLWKEVTIQNPHLRSREFCSPSLKVECPHNLFGILLYTRFIFFLPFINLLDYYINMDSWILFYTLDYNPILVYFVQIVAALAFRSSFSWFPMLLLLAPSMRFFLHFLTSWHYSVLQAYLVYFLPQS